MISVKAIYFDEYVDEKGESGSKWGLLKECLFLIILMTLEDRAEQAHLCQDVSRVDRPRY